MMNLVSETMYGKRCAMRTILTKNNDKMTVKHSILCTAEYFLRILILLGYMVALCIHPGRRSVLNMPVETQFVASRGQRRPCERNG